MKEQLDSIATTAQLRDTQIAVRDWMASNVRTVSTGTPVADAYDTMMRHGIRRLPVEEHGRLVGIVTLGDLREARPSPVTGLSIYELNYLLAKLTVAQVMTHSPYTVTPDAPMQDAARIMLDHKVGALPVVDERGTVVGIITESDIFRMLVEQWDSFVLRDVREELRSAALGRNFLYAGEPLSSRGGARSTSFGPLQK